MHALFDNLHLMTRVRIAQEFENVRQDCQNFLEVGLRAALHDFLWTYK